jgi:lysophospholipase L1-like esterase
VRRGLRLALVLASVLAAGAVVEGALRVIGYQYSPLKIGAGVKDDWREQHAFGDRHLVYDPVLIWRPRSGQFSPFNPDGFRGAPIDREKPAGLRRIVALGDSNTFGWDVDEGANWPAQLQALFSRQGQRAEVVNAGVWGYTSFQGRRRLDEILPFNPDIVLVSFGANDAHPVRVPDAAYVKRHDRIEQVTRATRHSRLAQLIVDVWDKADVAAGASGTLVPRVSVDEYAANLRAMIRSGKERGTLVVLLTRPFTGSSNDPASWKTYAPRYNEALTAVGREENVPVIDVYGAFHHRVELFDDESHFGVEGHRRAAELIYRELVLRSPFAVLRRVPLRAVVHSPRERRLRRPTQNRPRAPPRRFARRLLPACPTLPLCRWLRYASVAPRALGDSSEP